MLDFKNLRPPANYPTYPPYHVGPYLEEFFYSFYMQHKSKFDDTGFTLIPIFWTNIYNTGINRNLVQYYLDALPTNNYFTVSQHDDAVREKLPEGTLSFEAGGNGSGIPIPLICSALNGEASPLVKDILCSFVGSINTNPVRERLYGLYNKTPGFVFDKQEWSPSIPVDRLNSFIDITKRSKFSLCPRGYGSQSFRLYEVLQLGSIPVIVYDKEWFPFSDIINWDEFTIRVHIDKIKNINEIISNIDPDQQLIMIEKGAKIYKNYFTLDKTARQILRVLQNVKQQSRG